MMVPGIILIVVVAGLFVVLYTNFSNRIATLEKNYGELDHEHRALSKTEREHHETIEDLKRQGEEVGRQMRELHEKVKPLR